MDLWLWELWALGNITIINYFFYKQKRKNTAFIKKNKQKLLLEKYPSRTFSSSTKRLIIFSWGWKYSPQILLWLVPLLLLILLILITRSTTNITHSNITITAKIINTKAKDDETTATTTLLFLLVLIIMTKIHFSNPLYKYG